MRRFLATVLIAAVDTRAAGVGPVVAVLGANVVQEQDLADTGPREVMLLVTAPAAIIGLAPRGAERRLLPA